MAEKNEKLMPRGLIPSSPEVLAAAKKYTVPERKGLPEVFLRWPSGLSYWGNDSYGDCVSAEEAFAKACSAPFVCFSDEYVVGWADKYGFLNGASISAVLNKMQDTGMHFNFNTLYDGEDFSVDIRNREELKDAIYRYGPVKLGVAAKQFQGGADIKGCVTPGRNGWAFYSYPSGLPEDHCIGLCGYGSFSALAAEFRKHGAEVCPTEGMPECMCYALFTWSSIGIVDEASLYNMTMEAWIRCPVTKEEYEPTAGKFRLKNDGGFVVDIHALYRDPAESTMHDAANYDNFPIAQTRTMDLAAKCTDPPIKDGDVVQLKVWVALGKSNTYTQTITYHPEGPVQSFCISGATLNNSVQYLGALEK